jgi:ankyrin repeat protein
MRALLKLKASPDGGPDLDATPLMVAAASGSVGAAALLLEYGAAPSRANAAQVYLCTFFSSYLLSFGSVNAFPPAISSHVHPCVHF